VSTASASAHIQTVSVVVAGQNWGIPIAKVREVLGPQTITPVPLAPRAVAGSLNLRGRIVTVLDLRTTLGLPPTAEPAAASEVVVEHGGDLYSLLIDAVGDATALPAEAVEPPPQTLDAAWRALTSGIVKLDGQLLLVLDLDSLLRAVTVN
jgi:purine-binding chemotaxis protein CheW